MAVIVIAAVTVVLLAWIVGRHLSVTRRSRAELTGGEQYRALADEYRRLSDMAITAQEHVDLRLTDLGVQVDALRAQLDQMQHILKEVE